MGPLSAVAISIFLVLYGLTGIGSITASPHTLGWFAIIAAIVVLIDTFWVGSGRWLNRNNG